MFSHHHMRPMMFRDYIIIRKSTVCLVAAVVGGMALKKYIKNHRDELMQVKDTVMDKVQEGKEKVEEGVEKGKEKVDEIKGDVKDKIADAKNDACACE